MENNITETWLNWFYTEWEKFTPGDLLDNGVSASKIAEGFITKYENELLEFSKRFDHSNEDALNQFAQISESELHVLKFYLKLIKLKTIK